METFDGLLFRLKDMYSAKSRIIGDKDIVVLPVSDPDGIEKALQQQAAMRPQDPAPSLPAIGVSINSVSPNTESYNATVMRRTGIPIQIDSSRDTWTVLKARPVKLIFLVTFLTDDFMTMLKIVDRWESTEILSFNLNIDDSNLSVKIKVTPDKDVAVPPRTPGLGGADQFKLTTNVTVEGYSGFIWRVPSVRALDMTMGVAKPSAFRGTRTDAAVIANILEDPAQGIIFYDKTLTSLSINEAPEPQV